jgi:UDP:flavonoid glycosyltransferase YjiC (YdhE family)/quercetin dioxygenase-like cupin family protein
MRILFTACPFFGHVNTVLPLALAAQRAGHEVVVATGADFAAHVERRGLGAWPIGPTSAEAGTPRSPAHFFHTAGQRAADLLPLTAAWLPDLVVSEEMELAGAIAAARGGTRFVVHGLGISATGDVGAFAAGIDDLGRRWDVPDLADVYRSADYLSICPPTLQPPAASERTVQALRPSFGEPAPGDRLPEALAALPHEQTVHLTLGTVFHQRRPGVLEAAIAGLRELPANLVVTVGPGVDPDRFGPQPPHVLVERYLPHALLLPRCDLVVSQGGAGILFGALAHGLPQLVLPQGADQFANVRPRSGPAARARRRRGDPGRDHQGGGGATQRSAVRGSGPRRTEGDRHDAQRGRCSRRARADSAYVRTQLALRARAYGNALVDLPGPPAYEGGVRGGAAPGDRHRVPRWTPSTSMAEESMKAQPGSHGAGEIMENRNRGERFLWRQTTAQTRGRSISFELEIAPGGAVPAAHRHPGAAERFEVLSGQIALRFGKQVQVQRPGPVNTVSAGAAHAWWNAGDGKARVLVEFEPALHLEGMFRSSLAVIEAGHVDRKGRPNPLAIAAVLGEFPDEIALANRALNRVFRALAPIARLLGHRPHYPRKWVADQLFRSRGNWAPGPLPSSRIPPTNATASPPLACPPPGSTSTAR